MKTTVKTPEATDNLASVATPVSPLILERYELKYLIPFHMVEPISKYVQMFCELDYYSQISHDGFYTINSLYFETPTNYFLRQKDNQTGRYSLRVRSYGDQPKPPYYFETKEKIGDFSKKRRGKVDTENWSVLFTDPSFYQEAGWAQDKHIQHFLSLVRTYGAEPKILTQYRRKAYLSTVDDYARVTFDRAMRFRPEEGFSVNPANPVMVNYDHTGSFGYSDVNVVLELKCERKIPVWFVDLIRRFQLVRGGFSKFESSMKECFGVDATEDFVLNRVPHSSAPFRF